MFDSFKTKGNLTKHMKSKAHFKKCTELGLNPMDGLDQLDIDDIEGESLTSGDHTSTMPGDEESDSDDMMSDGEGGYSTGEFTTISLYKRHIVKPHVSFFTNRKRRIASA